MQQYFIDEELKINQELIIPQKYHQHIFKVMRMKDNDKVRLVDINQNVFEAIVLKQCFIIEAEIIENNELDICITAIIPLIKVDKFELMLQKIVELGVSKIVVLETKRSVVKIKDFDKKIERWNKIILEAAKQSKRNIIPKIEKIIKLNDVVDYKSDLNFVAYEKEKQQKIKLDKNKNITYIIGPEGGFEKQEIDYLLKQEFKPISLGKRILRAETAAIFMAANIVFKNECEE